MPLIVILLITATKDAIEDYRRTVLDNELNNTPIHILVDWHNPNVTDENISLWRRIKKATSRNIREGVAWYKAQKRDYKIKKKGGVPENRLERSTTRSSVYSVMSEHSESIQMTPVGSPSADKQRFSFTDDTEQAPRSTHLEVPNPKRQSINKPPSRFYGNVIDPHKTTPGKAKFKKDFWKNVRVGDFIRVYNDEEIPADVVILSTADSDGACYVETKNLDGETNLKVRHALHAGRRVRHAKDCEAATFTLESENPHANLYSYSGVVKWQQKDPTKPEDEGEEMAEPVSINNLLLRGCTLRNTQWVIGLVAFTGDETKIMMNAGITPSKRSRITRELNWNVRWQDSPIVSPIYAYFELGYHEFLPPLGDVLGFWYCTRCHLVKRQRITQLFRIRVNWWFPTS